MKKIGTIISLIGFCIFLMGNLHAQEPQQPENGHGGVSIGFGNGGEAVTLPGNSPNIPPKPKKNFYTNSLVLNQILGNYDNQATFLQNLDQLKEKGIVDYGEWATAPDLSACFVVVINQAEEIIAVLDKGGEKRINLLNNQFETLTQYAHTDYVKYWLIIQE
ncbi:MAG: hypothetical protein PHQ33_06565 [Bacteroidales bacterium]|jgi:hypothetical protein|nr:hypothetical protein [Bacteroidales bacterium]MDD4395529.1 hypothetical protein [Bacteroidales bacterium]